MQVYNLGVDEKTHKPSATFEYNVTNVATNKSVVQKLKRPRPWATSASR